MKIALLIGICTFASAVIYGCSGASSPNAPVTGNGGGTTPVSDNNSAGSGSTAVGRAGTASSGSVASTGGSGAVAGSGASDGGSSGEGGTTGAGEDGGMLGGGIMMSSAAPTDDPETDYSQTKTLTMDTFAVPANSEVFYCQSFANPWGRQVDIKTYDLEMDTGSHHMFAFYKSNATNGPAAPCAAGGLTFGFFTFVSQVPTLVQTFPATVGATIPQSDGFFLTAHYLNTTTSELTAHVKLTMYLAKPGVITNHAGVIFMNNVTMTVPSTGQPVVSPASMKLNQDVNILSTTSHMHKFGTNFVGTATPPGGAEQTLYATTQWDEPKPTVFSTPLQFPSGTNYTWSCTDVNTTGKTLTFGEYAETNVMCIWMSIFYPVKNISDPEIGSAVGGL